MCHFPQLKSDFTAFFNEAENEGALFAEGDSGALQVDTKCVALLILLPNTERFPPLVIS